MNKISLVFLLLLNSVLSIQAATITWIGPPSGNWNNAANWSGGIIPAAADDVIFLSSATIEMDIIPATTPFIYRINSILVSSGAAIILARTQAAGGTRILQVAGSSPDIPGLQIDADCMLTIDAGNATGSLDFVLDLTAVAGVTGSISGALCFTGTGAGNGNAHLNIYRGAVNYGNLTVKSPGLIKYFPNSGNTVSAPGAYLHMENGSTYELNKNGGSVPNGVWEDASIIRVTGATTNGSITFSQTMLGNLEWDTPNMSAVAQLIGALSPVAAISVHNLKIRNTNGRELRLKTGTASMAPAFDYRVRGVLEIGAGGILVITGANVVTAGAGARLHVMGDISNAGQFRSDGAAGTINELDITGSVNQNLVNSGSFSGVQLKLIMNNPAGLSLQTGLVLPGLNSDALQLLVGNIKTKSTAILTLLDNAGYSGGSSISLVEGPMIKTGDDPFIFPIGRGSIYTPVALSVQDPLQPGDAFQAEYFRLNPQVLFGINYQFPPIDHISYLEYWKLEKIAGDPARAIEISVPVGLNSFAKEINSLYIAAYDPAVQQWKTAGISKRISGPASPPYITGTLFSNPISAPGIFTLSASEPEPINPLPVQLRTFTAKKLSNMRAELSWQLTTAAPPAMIFEIEKKQGRQSFDKIGAVAGNNISSDYLYHDDQLLPGANYYRLKIADTGRAIFYSSVLLVDNEADEPTVGSIYPDPVSGKAGFQICVPGNCRADLVLYNSNGLLIKHWTEMIAQRYRKLTIDMTPLPPGIYYLSVTAMETRKILRFVKI